MLTVEGPPYFLGKLSGGCLLMALLSPAPTSSFLYSSDVVIPFSRTPFYPHGFTALMLGLVLFHILTKKIHLS